jgi:cytoskeletal protein CcmA (bactofilin family)
MFFKAKKKNREVPQVASEPSYIARDTSLEGNIICDGEIHIDGAVRGSVRAQTCLVDVHGEVHGEVAADVIFIRGRVIGPVTGVHVHIHAGSHVEGNVTNETISIENGAYVYGSIRHGGNGAQAPVLTQKVVIKDPLLETIVTIAEEPHDNVRALKMSKQKP